MYRTKEDTQKRKDEKRQMILDTAAKVFSLNGYHNTTVKDIVNEAAISIGSFYFYFKSKEELFSELYKSIVKEFDDIALSVLDVNNYSLQKNFTRVMMATLWLYEKKRALARIMLFEATTANPAFQKFETDRMKESAKSMAIWFKRFKDHNDVYIPDENVAALIYFGSYYYFVSDWLTSDEVIPLTEYGYGFCIYNLQALRIDFEEAGVKKYIDEILSELGREQAKDQGN